MTDDPAHDAIAAAIRAITELVTGPPNLIGFDFVDLREAFIDGGRAVFGQGEAEGPDRAIRAADAAIADIKRQLHQKEKTDMSDTPRPDNTGKSPGEGPERLPGGTYNKSGLAQREQAQKAGGNPKEKQAEAERINRDEALHRGGFPVAGHGEPEPENDPGRGRERSR